MPKQPGSRKTGGRKKGTPNRKTVDLQQALDDQGLNVVAKLSETLPQLAPDKRADVLLHLMNYIYPKRKAIEVTNERPPEDRCIKIEFVDTPVKTIPVIT